MTSEMLKIEHFDEMVRLLEGDVREIVRLAFSRNEPIAEAKIRLMAVLMRRWLVDGDLQKLFAQLRAPVLFDVQANGRAFAYANEMGDLRYLLTASVMANGTPVRFVSESARAPEEVDHRIFASEGRASLTLKKFLAQPRLLHNGRWFTTAQILRFVANKLGGNHLDFDRSGEWAALDAANEYFKYGGPILEQPPGSAELYLVLEPASREIIGGVHLEVIAAAASFVQMTFQGAALFPLEVEKGSSFQRLKRYIRKRPRMLLVERQRDSGPQS